MLWSMKFTCPKNAWCLHPATRPKLAWSLESLSTNPPPVTNSHGFGMMCALASPLAIRSSPSRSIPVTTVLLLLVLLMFFSSSMPFRVRGGGTDQFQFLVEVQSVTCAYFSSTVPQDLG